jgi:hypothetical protein
MKKIILGIGIIGFSFIGLKGQTVDGVNLAEKREVEYLQLVGYSQGLFKKKMVVIVDYGQKIKAFDTDTRVEGSDGKPIIFNSMMDAMNQFNGWGWELLTTYYVSVQGSGDVLHYVLRRKKA